MNIIYYVSEYFIFIYIFCIIRFSYAVKQMFFKTSYYSSNKQKTNLLMSDVSVNRPSSAVH